MCQGVGPKKHGEISEIDRALSRIAFGAPSSSAKGLQHTVGHPHSHLWAGLQGVQLLLVRPRRVADHEGRSHRFLGVSRRLAHRLSMGTLPEPDATLAHFPRRNFRARVLPLGPFDFEPFGLPHSPAVSFAGQLFEWVSAFSVGIDTFVPVWLALNVFLTRYCSGALSAP